MIARVCTWLALTMCAHAAPWIEWQPATDRVVSHTDKAAAYPRARRLSNGDILLGYHHGGGLGEYGTWVTLRRSRDGGATWDAARDVEGPEGEAFWGFSNVDFVELGGGRLMLVTAGRGKALPGEPTFLSEAARSSLRLRFSADFGRTWGEPMAVAAGRGRVWEPSTVRLPDGVLEIYYANEAPDLAIEGRLDQRLEVIRSQDDGRTWSAPVEIAQTRGCRNGMPAALVLRDGSVAIAQEVVRAPASPWITRTRAGERVDEALAQTRYDFGAAPAMLGMPDGATLLAFHSGFKKQRAPANAPVPWMFTSIWIMRGNADAKEFADASQPWPSLDPQTGAFFPALMLKDERTVVALASFLTHGEGETSRTVVRWIEGKLRP